MATKAESFTQESSHPHAGEILDTLTLLGMPSKLKNIASDLDVHDLLKHGLPRRSIQSLIKRTGFTKKEIGIGIALAERKLQSVGLKGEENVLSPLESLSIWQFAFVFSRAQRVFGTAEGARNWLFSKPIGTAFRRPIDLISLSPGVEFIVTYLHQIDHGVYV